MEQQDGQETQGGSRRPVRVIIADDDPIARRVIRDALQRAGVIVIAEARDSHDAVELSVHYRPDVVLMDVMPHINGIGAMRRILDRVPEVAVVMVSAYDEEELGLLCLRSGAVGYLSKSVDLEALPRATRAAAQGEAVISRRLTLRLIEVMRRSTPPGGGMRPVRSTLTAREWEVLDLLGRDLSTAEIASALVVSAETVRSHIKHIMRKLEVGSRREAVDAAQSLRSGPSTEGGEARPPSQV
jgi:DNA-binding NarL/FixJ family response regulator